MSAAIELRGVEKSFGDVAIIRNINLSVAQGERHALIGPNGAGKSTTFNLISGYMAPSSGSVLLRGQVISGLPPYQINRRGLSRSFQVTNVFANMSVWENLRCAVLWSTGQRYAFWKNIDNLPEVRDRTAQILADISLTGRRDVPAGLSWPSTTVVPVMARPRVYGSVGAEPSREYRTVAPGLLFVSVRVNPVS